MWPCTKTISETELAATWLLRMIGQRSGGGGTLTDLRLVQELDGDTDCGSHDVRCGGWSRRWAAAGELSRNLTRLLPDVNWHLGS
jgi:hypothetical protein